MVTRKLGETIIQKKFRDVPQPTGDERDFGTMAGDVRSVASDVVTISGGGGRGTPLRLPSPTGQSQAEIQAEASRVAQERFLTQQRTGLERGISNLQSRLDLGRVSDRQKQLIEGRIEGLRGDLGFITPNVPQSFQMRQIGSERGIPTTAFFNVATGKQVSLKQEEQLRQQLQFGGRDLVISGQGEIEGRIASRVLGAGHKVGRAFERLEEFETGKLGAKKIDKKAEREALLEFTPLKVFGALAEVPIRGSELILGDIPQGSRKATKEAIGDLFMISAFAP